MMRPLRETDRAEYLRVEGLSHAHFAPWRPARDVSDAAAFEAEVIRTRQGILAGTEVRLGAFDLHDGGLVGLFSLSQIFRRSFSSCYAGWRVSLDRARQGYGAEGVTGLLDLAFNDQGCGLALHRVQANIIPRNTASLRLAERVGFRREGLALRYLRINGVWEDHVMFARTAEEHTPAAEITDCLDPSGALE